MTVGELGSIFEDEPVASSTEKGPDVRVRAVVRRSELEAGQAVLVKVPDHVPYAGGTVKRRREPGDPSGAVRLHLSPQLRDGSTLRLRQQGGEHPSSGIAGDLLVRLAIEAPPPFAWGRLVVIAAALAAAAAAAWWSYAAWSG